MAQCTLETCSPDALLSRIEALETALQAPAFSGKFRYLLEHSSDILALAGAAAALIGGVALVLFIRRRLAPTELQVKSATLSLAGSSVTVEAAAQEISAFMADLQAYVLRDAALAPVRAAEAMQKAAVRMQGAPVKGAGTDRLPVSGDGADLLKEVARTLLETVRLQPPPKPDPGLPEDCFAALPAEPARKRPCDILWVATSPEAIRFETAVLRQMGNRVETVLGEGDATIRLRSGLRPDLVVVDLAEGRAAEPAMLAFAARLVRGLAGFDHAIDPPETRIGPGLRLAVLTAEGRAGAVRGQIDKAAAGLPEDRAAMIRQNLLVTDSFFALKERVDWLQDRMTARP